MFLRSAAIVAAACALGSAGTARADVTVTYQTTVDSPQIRQSYAKANAQLKQMMERQGLGKPATVREYAHGSDVRTEENGQSAIVDVGAHKITLMNPKLKKYLQGPIPSKPNPQAGPAPVTTVVDTGRSNSLLGHTVRIYTISIHPPTGQGGMTGEIWAAPDVPKMPYDPMTNNPASPLYPEMKKIKGQWLKMVLHVTGQQGPSTVTRVATAISTKPVPASLFSIPAGYTKVTMPTAPAGQMPGQPHR